MKALIIPLALIALSAPAFAILGEKPEKVIEEFGKPSETSEKEGFTCAYFAREKISVSVKFGKKSGVSEAEEFWKGDNKSQPQEFTDKEIEGLKKAEGGEWKKMPLIAVWERDDGATVQVSSDKKLVLFWSKAYIEATGSEKAEATGSTQKSNSAISQAANPAGTPKPGEAQGFDPIYSIGEKFTMGQNSFRVFHCLKSGGYTNHDGTRYVVEKGVACLELRYSIGNDGDETMTIPVCRVKLVDGQGRRYSPAIKLNEVLSRDGKVELDDFRDVQIQPGLAHRVTIAFVVPVTALSGLRAAFDTLEEGSFNKAEVRLDKFITPSDLKKAKAAR